MNAASRVHGTVHLKVAYFLHDNFPELEFSADEDLDFDKGKTSFRPDILGRDKNENLVIAVEVAVTSLKKDLMVAKAYYEMLGIYEYLVVDCNHSKVFHFKLESGVYKEVDNSKLAQELVSSVF